MAKFSEIGYAEQLSTAEEIKSAFASVKAESRGLLNLSTYHSIDEQSKWILTMPGEDGNIEVTCNYAEHDISGNYNWKNLSGQYPCVKYNNGKLTVLRTSTLTYPFDTGLTEKDPTSRDPEKNNLGGPYMNENVSAVFISLVPGVITPDGGRLLKSSDVIDYPNDTSALVQSFGVKSFVNSSIQNMAAFYITDISGQPFESYSMLSNTASSDMYCGGKQWTPQRNDYCIVREDETQTGEGPGLPTSRYIYNPGATQESVDYNPLNWEFQYTINDSGFTQEQLNAINSGISKSKVEKLNALPTQEELQAEFDNKLNRTDYLSSINDNEISNYVNADTNQIRIGVNSANKGNSFAIGNSAKVYGNGNVYSTAVGDYTTISNSIYAEAIGRNAKVTSANYACQIGKGENTNTSSLQFLDTTVVNSEGVIPISSLEFNSVNGILSSDGKGHIVSADIPLNETDFNNWLSSTGIHAGLSSVGDNSYSIAFGELSKSTGERSIAIGRRSQSTSYDSIACGSVAEANSNYSIAIGNQSKVNNGIRSISIGNNVTVKGNHAIAIGYDIDSTKKTSVNADLAIQLGCGENNLSNTFKVYEKTVLDYDADTSSHYIPNDILELASTNGVLSSDGKGHIVSANISIDHLSSIGDNEISGYVRQDATTIVIGDQQGTTVNKGENGIAIGSVVESGTKPTYKNNVVIGHYSYMEDYGSNNVIIGAQSKVEKGYRNIAVGNFAQISGDITDSCQIGSGVNTQVSSLQFLNTTVVNSEGRIPNDSLEFKSVNGILSSDGNGNINAYDIDSRFAEIEQRIGNINSALDRINNGEF